MRTLHSWSKKYPGFGIHVIKPHRVSAMSVHYFWRYEHYSVRHFHFWRSDFNPIQGGPELTIQGGLVVVLRGNGSVSSISLHNYDQFSFQLFTSIRSAKLVVVLEGNGRNSSTSPKTTTKVLPFPSITTTKLHLFPYDQGVQDFEENWHFLLTEGV